MLSRRIPLIPTVVGSAAAVAKSPISALPLHMQRSVSVGQPRLRTPQLPIRSQTPPLRPQSPVSVPHRPDSPFRARTSLQAPMSPTAAALPPPLQPPTNVEVDLTVEEFIYDSIRLEKPFEIPFRLGISAPVPTDKTRTILLAVQHVLPPRTAGTVPVIVPQSISRQETLSGRSTPSPTGSPQRGEFGFPDRLTQRLIVASPRVMYRDEVDDESLVRGANTVVLPPPFGAGGVTGGGVEFLGASALFLDPVHLKGGIASLNFSLTYMPMHKGYSTVGGLRILLVGDQLEGEDKEKEDALPLKEWDIIAELWVQG